jgi:hypothetical protein
MDTYVKNYKNCFGPHDVIQSNWPFSLEYCSFLMVAFLLALVLKT